MNTSSNRNQIISELEQIHKLLVSKDKLSNLEIDLILSKLRSSYDLVLNLDFSDETKKVEIAEPIKIETPIEAVKAEEVVEQKVEEIEETLVELVEEPKTEVAEEIIEEKPVVEEVKPEIKEEKFVNIQTEQKSVNDIFQSYKNQPDLSAKFKSQPIKNIKSSIGLNDRFLMINELFSGKSDKFNSFIENIDSLQNLDEATNYIRENLTWDETQTSATQLLELVYRRFAV